MTSTPSSPRRRGTTAVGATIGVALALAGGAAAVGLVLGGGASARVEPPAEPRIVTEYVDQAGNPVPAPTADP